MSPSDPLNDPITLDLSGTNNEVAELRRQLGETAKLGNQFGAALGQAFEGLALKGKSLGDVVRSLGLSLSKIALNAAFKPLEQALGGALSNLFSGGSMLPFANGGVIAQGMPIPFAHGGVIASPTTFPLAGGRTGLMGEAGAEAIMPLARGPDGRLGVAASGRGQAVNITFNVSTPDVESFRRSETQMAALLSRAVSQGQRNL
jgi:phage-related minor tail protein